MMFDADTGPFMKAWEDLNHQARLHGITLIAVTYANHFGLLQPREGLNPRILSGLDRVAPRSRPGADLLRLWSRGGRSP